MKILVMGKRGQLARSLVERARADREIELIAVGRPELELKRPESAAALIRASAPDLVVNAAAYTAVDQAEDEPARAYRINADAAGEVAAAAAEIGVPVIHLSTDYVFDGASSRPYREDDPTGPINVYGETKLKGEELVRAANPAHFILRTSWVYSPFGANFVKSMLRLAQERDAIGVVADQRGCPTSALDLADAILMIARRVAAGAGASPGETYHVAGTEASSWAEFATSIFSDSDALGGPNATVRPIATAEYPTRAARPANSSLDATKFAEAFNYRMPDRRASLAGVVKAILERTNNGQR